MKIIAIVIALLLVTAGGVSMLAYRGGMDSPLNRPSERSEQPSGGSTAGRTQEMSPTEAADDASTGATGERARNVQRSGSGDLALTPQQRQAVAAIVSRLPDANRVDPSAMSISVGASVARQIPLRSLPSEVTDLLDRYRGDDYALTSDSLIIIEPKSRRIVAIIPIAG